MKKVGFDKIYPLYVAKAERKGRTKAEVDEVIGWLTGYSADQIERAVSEATELEDFFALAPQPNLNRMLIKGSICGVKIAEIDDPVMRDIRCLDKLIDELAKGKSVEKITQGKKEKLPK